MSYCVNCGVELGDAEKACPLCQTPVINPVSPWKEPQKKPYPDRVDKLMRVVDYKFGVRLAALLLIIPVFVTLLCNIAVNKEISWSIYVIGGVTCFFVWVFLPLLFKKRRPYVFVLLDGISTAAYLAVIALMTGGLNWFLTLALPLVSVTLLTIMLFIFIGRRKKISPLHKMAAFSLGIGILSVAIELIIDLFLYSAIVPVWSLYVLTVTAVFAAVFALVESKKRWKEEIIRKLFY